MSEKKTNVFRDLLCRLRIGKLRKADRDAVENHKVFAEDERRYLAYAGAYRTHTRESSLALLIAHYHAIEKGLTMPEVRMGFGREAVERLMVMIDRFVSSYGLDDLQVRHAIGTLKEYLQVHRDAGVDLSGEDGRWQRLTEFLGRFPDIAATVQPTVSRDEFFAETESPFPAFAASRHMIRNYAGTELPIERIREAVRLALTTPSSCNRQYARVWCVTDRKRCQEVMALQKGNRGFGHLADKALVVTANLENAGRPCERFDAFVNGGMFLMNLCYALYYQKIAHCVLHWSVPAEDDRMLHELLGIPPQDAVVAVIACGEAPERFRLVNSPRKDLSAVFSVV